MTNTIPNVPRQLLERAATSIEQRMCIQCEGVPCCMPESLNTLSDIRALLSAPSPAGVDGLNTDRNAAFKACPESGCDWGSFYLGWKARGEVEQAIIDGLRGEIEVMTQHANNYSRMFEECAEERDQQDQRICELASHLEFAVTMLTVAGLAGNAQVAAMRAALSAGKEGE